jgi:diphthine-ammonia ligase
VTSTALVSGGKDSIYSASLAEAQGWPIDELVTMVPSDPESMLFHTPNLRWVELQAEAWGKRFRRVPIEGAGEEAETAALRSALTGSSGIVTAGAIQSSYQWARLHTLCFELGRRLYAPLWGKEPGRVVRAEIDAGLDIRLVHLAADRLDPSWAGERLDHAMLERLEGLHAHGPGVNAAGEGGEYESLVVDAPFFRARLAIDVAERQTHGATTRWSISAAHLEPKS